MSNTALMQLTTGAELTEYDALIMAELADEPTPQGLQLPRIKIAPGGIGAYQIGEDTAKSFTAIIAVAQGVRGYWPMKESGNIAPLCSSTDALVGIARHDIGDKEFEAAAEAALPHPAIVALSHKQPLAPAYDCATCPMAQFGSQHQGREKGKPGKGQACKSMVRMLLLIDGWTMPAILSLPPTSIKAWGAYYMARQAKRGEAYFVVRTKFELDAATTPTGIRYNTAKFSMAGKLTLEEARLVSEIRSQFKTYVRSAAVEAQEFDGEATEGQVVDSTATDREEIPF